MNLFFYKLHVDKYLSPTVSWLEYSKLYCCRTLVHEWWHNSGDTPLYTMYTPCIHHVYSGIIVSYIAVHVYKCWTPVREWCRTQCIHLCQFMCRTPVYRCPDVYTGVYIVYRRCMDTCILVSMTGTKVSVQRWKLWSYLNSNTACSTCTNPIF